MTFMPTRRSEPRTEPQVSQPIIFLPPYSPDLNLIELMFGNDKMLLKRHRDIDWLVAHQVSILRVSQCKELLSKMVASG